MPWRRVPAAASAHRLAEPEPQRAETEEPSRPSRCETLAHALTRARVELRRFGPLTRSLQRSAKTQMPRARGFRSALRYSTMRSSHVTARGKGRLDPRVGKHQEYPVLQLSNTPDIACHLQNRSRSSR